MSKMSDEEDIPLDNPWLIVVIKDNAQEFPSVILQNWLIDNNGKVLWPPSYMVSRATKLKCNPQKTWTCYDLKSVYWDTRTNNYKDALKKAEIAEETSDVEKKWQEWVQRDRNSRKLRAQKENDDVSFNPLKKVKKKEEKSEEKQTVELFKPEYRPSPPPEILIKSSENNVFQNSEDSIKSPKNSRADDESTTKSTDEFKETSQPGEISTNVEKSNEIRDAAPNVENNKTLHSLIFNNLTVEKSPKYAINEGASTSARTFTPSKDDTSGRKPRPVIKSEKKLINHVVQLVKHKPIYKRNSENLELYDDNSLLNKNVHKDKCMESNDEPSNIVERPQLSDDLAANKESKIKKSRNTFSDGNILSPEVFGALPIDEKLNALAVAQTQLIANQCQMRVVVDNLATKKDVNEVHGLSMDEILALKASFPLEDLDQFLYLDNVLKENETYRNKFWLYAQTFIVKTNWRKTIRSIIQGIMCNVLQMLFSCLGQKGKISFKETFFYYIVEVTATTSLDPGYRASITEVQTYISDWLKLAKARTGGYDKENEKNKKKQKKPIQKVDSDARKSVLRLLQQSDADGDVSE